MKIVALIFCGLVAAVSSFAALPGRSGDLEEGVYGHVDPDTKEIVELRGGRFRYWFSSDVRSDSDPHYPLSGRYEFSKGTLVLKNPQIYQTHFRFRIFKGVATLWNEMAIDYWKTHPKDQQFRTLFKQQYTPEEIWRSDFHRRLKWND